MDTIKLIVDGKEQSVPVKPLTIICKGPEFTAKIDTKEALVLDPEDFIYHADRVSNLHAYFHYWYMHITMKENFKVPAVSLTPAGIKIVSATYNLSPPLQIPDEIRAEGIESKYLMGLIDLTLKMADKQVPLYIKNPEAFQHPGRQLRLGDFFIALSKGTHKQIPSECLLIPTT